MKPIHKILSKLAPLIPARLGQIVRKQISLHDFDLARRQADNPFHGDTGLDFPNSKCRMGIIEDATQYHKHYIAACRELGVSYRVLNLLASDWVETFNACECDGFLVWPSSYKQAAKSAFDNRLRILEQDLDQVIYPNWEECWLTEHKPRLRNWLNAHGIPHPKTWVFYDKQQALDFSNTAPLPIVVKTATGAAASGVEIIQSRSRLRKAVHRYFGKGTRVRSAEPWDRQRGFVFLQEFLGDELEEWRMVRIGDSFFGHPKGRSAQGFHSGAGVCHYEDPGPELLNLLKNVTDKGNFRSMDVDVFVTPDKQMYVNECQTVFGCSVATTQMKVSDVAGRYLWRNDEWVFEPGEFCANHMCNLRVQWLLDKVAAQSSNGIPAVKPK